MENKKEERPLILITNDDGYLAKGIAALVEAAKAFGDVVVIAPDSVRSGMSHAVTMSVPLRITHLRSEPGVEYYKTNGTPSDCVKLGQKVVLKDRNIDLILSGINHGANTSVSVIYSGTMAAAMEGSIENYKSIGFSLLDYAADADFTTAIAIAKEIIAKVLTTPIPNYIALNVNIPQLPLSEIRGIRITRQTHAYWHEDLIEKEDPYGEKYYWLSGYLEAEDDLQEGACEWAVRNGYVSIQPVQFDLTAYDKMEALKFFER